MAQKTRAQLQAQINSLLATNTAGDISATDVRTVDGDNIDSNLNLSDGGEMSGAITGNIAITGFRPIISTTSATINLLPGTHDGTFIYSNSAPAVTVNIFTKAITDFPLGTEIDIIQAGAGVVTLTPATGVNLNGLNTAIAITAQWGGVTLKQITDNNWIAIGKI
tara:strand:+ start:2460 stop:2954 length:495 start_codon:yes stop_codon:yes gene_type:complete